MCNFGFITSLSHILFQFSCFFSAIKCLIGMYKVSNFIYLECFKEENNTIKKDISMKKSRVMVRILVSLFLSWISNSAVMSRSVR